MEGGKVIKTTEITFGSTKWKFSTRKKHFTPGKKIKKNDFVSSEKYSSYAPGPSPQGPNAPGPGP